MPFFITRRQASAGLLALPFARPAAAADWSGIEAAARGQTVYFNAWAGSDAINAYIAWVADEVQSRYGITLVQVKIADAAEVVRRVRDEMNAGTAKGSVDLVWINGENFRAMKQEKLLYGPFAEALPNFRFVDVEGKPTTRVDFAEPVAGFESPWGMAQLTFFADGAKVKQPPLDLGEWLGFAEANPGRVTYPAPPDFHGTTFVKQVLVDTIADRAALARPILAEAFAAAAKPAFAFLDRLHPALWRGGKQFPPSQAQVTQLLADGELLLSLTFNPNEPANLVAAGRLPASTMAWQFPGGTIGNTHFVAIPANAPAKEAAQVVANFLLSPETQARKAGLAVWGDPTVLAMAKLPAEDAARFPAAAAGGGLAVQGPAIPEPHGSWVPLIEAGWLERYGA